MHKPNLQVKVTILYALLGLISITWFKSGHLIYFTDSTFPFSPFYDLKGISFTWSNSGFGSPNNSVIFFPYFITMYIFHLLLPLWISQWLSWYIIIVSSGIGFFLLVSIISPKFKTNVLAPIVGGIAYMLSAYWIFSVLQDPTTAMIFYPIYPLFIYSFINFLDKSRYNIFNKYQPIIISLFFLYLPAIFSPYTFILIFSILYFFIVSYVVRKPDRKSIKNQIVSVLVLLAFTSGIFFVFFGEIYAYYSGGFTAVTSNTSNSLENTLYYWLTLNSHGFIYSLLNTGYTLGEQSAPVFGWKWFSYYTSFPFFIIINAGWPVLAFLSIIFIKKIKQYDDAYRYYISFLTLSIIGIILQTGTALPTGPLYTWLFFHFPPIRVFDTLNLWYSPILYLSYGVLSVFSISCVFSSLETKLKSNSSNRNFRRALKASARYLWIFLVILWLLSPSYPLFGGAAVPNGTVSAQVELPNYEIATVYFLNSQNGSFRVISLPLFAYDSEENYPTGGYFGTNPLYLQLRPGISYIGSTGSMSSEELSSVNALLRALYSNSTQVVSILLSQLGIRYIVVTGDYSTDVT
ncbi:MAG: hypothetical protein QW478_09835, partial [Candidatus Micrarchaeaceae archaeon]